MTPILFYGVPSGCSLGSIVALEWLGLPYRLCRMGMPDDISHEDYARINAVHETPSLMTETRGLISESMAILNHVGSRNLDSGLAYAQGSVGFDRLNQMLAFLNTTFFNAFAPLWYVLEHDLRGEEKRVLTAYGQALVTKAHADLEAMLGDSPWLLGDQRTLADAYFVGIARWSEYHDVIDRRSYPGLQRLFERLQADPAVRFAHAIEREEEAASAGGFQGHVSLREAVALLEQPD